jgi:coenzyme Q-binding protein COQ10
MIAKQSIWKVSFPSGVVGRRMNARQFFSSPAVNTNTNATMATKRHQERKLFKFPMSVLYNVVSDVDNYKHFVPWCKDSVVLERNGNKVTAELVVGFQYLQERYVSNVTLTPPHTVAATSSQAAVFEHLKSEWKFTPASDPNNTWVNFYVEFRFKSALYNEVSELFMSEVAKKMVQAFEKRCMEVTRKPS